tara:strand:- start:1130 stop:1381 length:252 start_codon:yes stop_codon:yes gene_type:complete
MSRTYINTVENAVKKIGILCAEKCDVKELTQKEWKVLQDNILLIESHMQDLIHLYDLLDERKKSDYFHADMDELVLKKNEDDT